MGGYNGWSNYETWNVNLWITSDPGLNSYIEELAESAVEDNYEEGTAWEDVVASATAQLAESILWGAALGEVDWAEIAEPFVGEEADEYKILETRT